MIRFFCKCFSHCILLFHFSDGSLFCFLLHCFINRIFFLSHFSGGSFFCLLLHCFINCILFLACSFIFRYVFIFNFTFVPHCTFIFHCIFICHFNPPFFSIKTSLSLTPHVYAQAQILRTILNLSSCSVPRSAPRHSIPAFHLSLKPFRLTTLPHTDSECSDRTLPSYTWHLGSVTGSLQTPSGCTLFWAGQPDRRFF